MGEDHSSGNRRDGYSKSFVADPDDRLESWNDIAVYLRRDIRTLHRWEHDEGLPVHRHQHRKRGTVYAYRTELDGWRNRRRVAPSIQPPVRRIRAGLAVLPFRDLSAAGDGEYFSDGVTEDVITELGRSYADAIRVIARTSAIQYKSTSKSIADIGRELGVRYIIEGTVRRSADRVRLTVQLIDAADQSNVWSESYDRDLRVILSIQQELAGAVALRIGATLAACPQATGRRSIDPDALEAYLNGRFHWSQLSANHLDVALQYFHLALERDPTFALGYEGIAGVWLMRGDAGFLPPGETLMKAKTAALKAHQLDPTLAAVHVILANIAFCNEWDWNRAATAFNEAIRLNPNCADAHFFYADFLIAMATRVRRNRRWSARSSSTRSILSTGASPGGI